MNDKQLLKMLYESLGRETVAVIEKERRWSYAEFKQYALFARDYFVSKNIRRVMLCLPQGFMAYSIIWGAYLANTVFCPVNTKNPEDRVLYFAQVFKPDLILSDWLSIEKIGLVPVSPSKDFFSGVEVFQSDLIAPTPYEGLAYVIFTSGSTGLPKGVQISRTALENFLTYIIKAWDVKSHDVWGQYSNLGFDLSIADIFVSVLCGATLVPIASESEKLLPGNMIKKHQITFWHSVPSVVDLLARADALTPHMLSSLKKISFCGEKLFKSQLDLLFQANSNLVVFNTYGPTETTLFCSLIKLTSADYADYADNTISIGTHIDGMKLWLENVDEDGFGELLISGCNVPGGYLASDSESQSAFFQMDIDGERAACYRTGDYAYMKNEKLYIQGRRDNQIKKMGNRIDLSEIDHCVRTFTGTASSTVVRDDKMITFIERGDFSESEVYEQLRSKLPDYYIPQQITILDKLPLNENGKINNRALREIQ